MKKNFAHFENFVPQHLTRDRTMGTTDAENRVQKNIFSFKNCQTTKGPIYSEDKCGIFQLPKKYSVFLSLACWLCHLNFCALAKFADLATLARE